MRLLYVIDSLAPGGAETSLAEMAPSLIERGIELHVLPLGSRLDLAPRLEQAGATIHLPTRGRGRLANVRSVRGVARSVRPDLVHTTLYEADVAGRVAARSLRIPVSTSIVSDSYGPSHYAESNSIKLHAARALEMTTVPFGTRFHAVSTAIADSVSRRLRLPRERVSVIPRGRDPRSFPFQPQDVREATRRALGVSPSRRVLLSVGRLEPAKGQTHLLSALSHVAKANPDVLLLIAGKDGRSGDVLRAQAARLPCEVRFLGHRTDISALLAVADVFCFPSEREGLPGALIEALAVGCPIVASSIAPNIEVVGNGAVGAGALVPVADVANLANAINHMLANPVEAQQQARRGRARFDRLFTIDVVGARMASFFDRAQQGCPMSRDV